MNRNHAPSDPWAHQAHQRLSDCIDGSRSLAKEQKDPNDVSLVKACLISESFPVQTMFMFCHFNH